MADSKTIAAEYPAASDAPDKVHTCDRQQSESTFSSATNAIMSAVRIA